MSAFSLTIAGLIASVGVVMAAGCSRDTAKEGEIIVVHPAAATDTKQGLPNFIGISGKNTGAQHISMNKVVIPPGKSAKAHVHKGFESVVYIIRGRVKTLYGEGLKKSVINEAGDFLYIPADLPHKPINLSDTEAAEAIVARTDPNEQESVEQYVEPSAEGANRK